MVNGMPTASISSMTMQEQHPPQLQHTLSHKNNPLGCFQQMNRLADEDENPFLLERIKYPGKNGKIELKLS